jgi:hypothetical protein
MHRPLLRILLALACVGSLVTLRSAAPAAAATEVLASDLDQAAAQLEAVMADHLQEGQVYGVRYGSAARTPGDVVGIDGGGDSAIWTGHYLAAEAFRYAVAKRAGDAAAQAAAKARIDLVAYALHRNSNISASWQPTPCAPDQPPTGGPHSCGGFPGEAGELLRNCRSVGSPFVATGNMIFGPLDWVEEDGRTTKWMCEDGTSRDQYAGVILGLVSVLQQVGADDPALRDRTARDVIGMTDYLVRHGWSVFRPHTFVSTSGSENFVYPLFVNVPTARLNMAASARYAASLLGDPVTSATWNGVWAEEWASQSPAIPAQLLVEIASPHNSYYVHNLEHIVTFNLLRTVPEATTREVLRRHFAIVDETTRDDLNAHFETLTYAMTGETWRLDEAAAHLAEWIDYRNTADDPAWQAKALRTRCRPPSEAPPVPPPTADDPFAPFVFPEVNAPMNPSGPGDLIDCVQEDEVQYFQDSPSGPQRTVQPAPPGSDPALTRARVPLPVVDRVRHHDFLWQRSGFELRSGPEGAHPESRENNVDYLLPYWMQRFLTEVDEPRIAPFPDWPGVRAEAPAEGWSGPPADPAHTTADPRIPGSLKAYVGAMHEHSGYSDGWAGSTPQDFYRSGRDHGLDFVFGSDHSDTTDVPVVVNDGCTDPTATPGCVGGDNDTPTNSMSKWEATAVQARAATSPTFTAARGFEWTSDRFGHISVYFSRNDTNAKVDGGYASMATFYDWLARRPDAGGGADGLAVFNHPDAKKLQGVGGSDPQVNWDDLAYVPAADRQMVGIEVYNDVEFDRYGPWYDHALDNGWHVGAIGAEDLGHRRTDDWGGPAYGKTVVLATDRSQAAYQAAMQERRFYAVVDTRTRLTFLADGAPMGSRLTRPAGTPVLVTASVAAPAAAGTVKLELVGPGGAVLATGAPGGSLTATITTPASGELWAYVRATDANGHHIAYGSPVWLRTGAWPRLGEWIAGDLHVHTCESHDAFCGPDDRASADAFYSQSGNVDERFQQGAAVGLDWLAITDHHNDDAPEESGAQSWREPGFGGHGLIGVPAHENSLSGHGQMLGAKHAYPAGDKSPAAVNAMAAALRADGGLLQANHPGGPASDCADIAGMDWGYGYDVQPDTIEVWNGTYGAAAVRFWECWLDRGAHVAATGGSDSHALVLSAVQGVGNPSTWVFARERSPRGVLDALHNGRTSISQRTPREQAAVLVLEADRDGDGVYESLMGDTVPGGTRMRVRIDHGTVPPGGVVRVRANSTTLLEDEPLAPGGTVEFTSPADAGWVRAELGNGASGAVLAMTSALYLGDATDVTPVVPETSAPVALLLGAVLVLGGVALRRRRSA